MSDLTARLTAIGADKIKPFPFLPIYEVVGFGLREIEPPPSGAVAYPVMVASDVHRAADAALDEFIGRLEAELKARAGMKGYWRRAPNHTWDRDYETDTERHVYRCRLIFVPEDMEAAEP